MVLAQDRSGDRPVAIKLLRSRLGNEPKVLARFRREGEIQASLRHPNVVALYDQDLEAETPYLVMEYVEGETLWDRVQKRGPLTLEELLRLGRELASGVAELHARGILHRDIKPENSMIREQDGSAVLMDLGLVQVEERTRLTATGAVVGTPFFLPPEVLGAFAWSPRADVFQLGALLFFAATGTAHVASGGAAEVCERIVRGEWIPFPENSPHPSWFRALVERCLSRDPSQRPPDAQALLEALREETTGEVSLTLETLEALETLDPSPPDGPPGTSPPRSPSVAGAGVSTRALPVLTTQAADERASSPTRVLLLWLLVGAGLGFGFGSDEEPPAVTWEVVGDALVAGLSPAPSVLPRLFVDLEEVKALPDPGRPGRLVYRGLPRGESFQALLTWEGGSAGPREFTAEEDCLAPEVGLAGEGDALALEMRRPSLVSLVPPLRGAFWLQEGARQIPAPPLEELRAVSWMERGIRFSRPLSGEAVRTGTLRKLFRSLDRASLEDAVAPPGSGGVCPLEGFRSDWIPLLPRLPDLLAETPGELGEELWERWQDWSLSHVRARFAGRDPAPLELPRGAIGSLGLGVSPWERAGELLPPLVPDQIGGYPNQDPVPAEDLPVLQRREGNFNKLGPREIRFPWPEIPPGVDRVALAVQTRTRNSADALRFRIRAAEGTGPSFQVWGLKEEIYRSARSEGRKSRAWLWVCLPRSRFPAPGTGMSLELLPLATEFAPEGPVYGVKVLFPLDRGGAS